MGKSSCGGWDGRCGSTESLTHGIGMRLPHLIKAWINNRPGSRSNPKALVGCVTSSPPPPVPGPLYIGLCYSGPVRTSQDSVGDSGLGVHLPNPYSQPATSVWETETRPMPKWKLEPVSCFLWFWISQLPHLMRTNKFRFRWNLISRVALFGLPARTWVNMGVKCAFPPKS